MTSLKPIEFDSKDPELNSHINALLKLVAPPGDPRLREAKVAQEIIITALKALRTGLPHYELRILSRSIRELRYAFKVFREYRSTRKATVFGSARTPKTHPDYLQCKKLAQALSKRDFMVITGAGPGIMEAGNEGATRDMSFGINIKLPFEQKPNPIVKDGPRNIDCHFFFTRKLLFLKETSAVICFPGGFGTLDEGFEILTLVQTSKTPMIPIVLMDSPGGTYWKSLLQFIETQLLSRRLISEEDMNLFKVTDSVEEAVGEITGFYRNYHSMRFVEKNLVLRMEKAPDSGLLQRLNEDFKDIVAKDAMIVGGPFEAERQTEPDLNPLERLSFAFKRMHCGRLRQLINRWNEIEPARKSGPRTR